MKSRLKKMGLVLLMGGLVASLVSCGEATSTSSSSSSSSSSDSSSSDSSSSSSYSGNVVLAGSISVFGSDLSSVQDDSALASLGVSGKTHSYSFKSIDRKSFSLSSLTGLNDQVQPNKGHVHLYEMTPAGYVHTGLSVEVDEDGGYEFDGIAEDKLYMVDYIATGNNAQGNASYIRQFGPAVVGNGTTHVTANILPSSEYLGESLAETVDTFKEDVDLDIDRVEEVLEVFEDVVVEVIEEGQVIESRLHELPDTNLVPTLDGSVNGDTATMMDEMFSNTTINNTTEGWLTYQDLQYDGEVDLEGAKEIILRAFGIKEGGGGNNAGKADIPSGIINGFAQKYVDEKNNGVTGNTYGAFIDAYLNSLDDSFSALRDPNQYKSTYVEALRDHMTDHFEAINTYHTNGGSSIPTILREYSPSILFELFSEEVMDDWDVTMPDSQIANVAQSVMIFRFMGFMDPENKMIPLFPSNFDYETAMSNLDGGHDMFFEPMEMVAEMDLIDVSTGNALVMYSRAMITNVYNGDDNEIDVSLTAEFEVYMPGLSKEGLYAQIRYTDLDGDEKIVSFNEDEDNYGGGDGDNNNDNDNDQQQQSQPRVGLQEIQSKSYAALIRENNSNEEEEEEDDDPEMRFRLDPWDRSSDRVTDVGNGTVYLELLNSSGNVIASSNHEVVRLEGYIPEVTGVYNWELNLPIAEEGDTIDDYLLSWQAFRPSNGTSIPNGYSIYYAIEIGLMAQSRHSGYNSEHDNFDNSITDWDQLTTKLVMGEDYDGSQSWDRSDSWDHEYSSENWSDKWEKLWSSWENRFDSDLSFKLPVSFSQTYDSDSFSLGYGIDLRPVLVSDETGQVVWEGMSEHFNVSVQVAEEWTATINGTVHFPPDYFATGNRGAELEAAGGTWKAGIFETYDKTLRKQVFDSTTAYDRAPISSGNVQYVSDLSGTGTSRTYSFDSFTVDNMLFDPGKEYQILVWFDLDEAEDNGIWETYGDPKEDVLDFYIESGSRYNRRFPIEEFVPMHGRIETDGQFVKLTQEHRGHREFRNLSTEEDAQEIDIFFHIDYHDVVDEEIFHSSGDAEFKDGEAEFEGHTIEFEDDGWDHADTGGDHGDDEHVRDDKDEPLFEFQKGDEYDTEFSVNIIRDAEHTIEVMVENHFEESGSTYNMTEVEIIGKKAIRVVFQETENNETYNNVVHLMYHALEGSYEKLLFLFHYQTKHPSAAYALEEAIEIASSFSKSD